MAIIKKIMGFITIHRSPKDGDKGEPGRDGTNYLVMGWWDPTISYKLSDAGIPIVKVEDDSDDGFSVYKLIATASTIGAKPPNNEWEKVQSAEFIYMQQAYIERLQAQLISAVTVELKEDSSSNVTAGISGIQGAQKILPAFWAGGTYDQAIGGTAKAIIRHDGSSKFTDTEITGEINALSGEIGNIAIENGGLISNGTSGAFYISPDGAMHLYDSNGSVRTSIKAGDIPDISAYFNHSGSSQQVGLNAYSSGASVQYSSTFTVSAPQGGTYRLLVPSVQLNASAIWNNSVIIYPTSNSLISSVNVFLERKVGAGAWTTMSVVGYISAAVPLNVGTPTPPKTVNAPQTESSGFEITMTGSASYRLRFEYSLRMGNGHIPPMGASGSGSARTLTRQFQTIPVINRSEIGNNGMMIATDNQNYTYMVDDLFQVRRGNVYFRVTSSGIQKSTNGTDWTNL